MYGGAPGVSALTGQDTVIVHTKRKEAEYFEQDGRLADSTSNGDPGVARESTGDTEGGGQNVGFIEPGDWFAFDAMNLTNINEISLRVASPNTGTVIEVRQGAPDGTTVATIPVPNTGGWQVYQNVSAPVVDASLESGPLYFVETAGGSNINWIDFVGDGVTDNRRPVLTATADVTSGPGPLEVAFAASATDPDDDAVTFAWTFGDGETGQGGDVSHTYTEPGSYTAQVTATDARGAVAKKTFAIRVFEEEETCFTGRSDGFDGTSLDLERWDSVVRPNDDLTVADGALSIPLTSTDIYGPGGTPTPNIVLQHLPGGAFTTTTKVNLAAVRQYQQAGLIIYGDDDNYLKMVLQGRTATPDSNGTIIQFASELAGTATETNTTGLGAAFTDTAWVRMTSTDGLTVSASYSLDGQDYVDLPGTRSLAGINEPRVGIFGLANNEAALPITASFDYFQITPDDTAVPCEPGGAPTVEVTTSPAAPDGDAGWFTGPVTVTGSVAGGVGESTLEYRIGDGAWASYTAPVVVSTQGTTEVSMRATDAEGTVSEVVTTVVKIDTAAPTAKVTGIRNGQTLNVAAIRRARVSATDATSGVASERIRLDGAVVTSPVVIDAVELRSGTHRLVVTVVDRAGNTTVQTIRFQVEASYAGGKALVQRLDRENRVSGPNATKLRAALVAAQKADNKGQKAQARAELNQFERLARTTSQKDAKAALVDLARQLKRQL